ncbi:hypothetical protein [Colwellia sp. TT2012]|uniref:hypothetical protein n=1 Tax=Colwellia sp. TT2012 TaxID=1720342 RepID=UPI00070EA0DB|nr:hypothetical protein [Colwellia sp. TT2012]
MPTCTEFAVFEVKHANLARIITLSESLFAEINAEQKNIVAHEILVKTALAKEHLKENSVEGVQEVCWHLTWANVAAVEASSSKWSTYPSAAEIDRLVGKKLYYGHFVAVIAK